MSGLSKEQIRYSIKRNLRESLGIKDPDIQQLDESVLGGLARVYAWAGIIISVAGLTAYTLNASWLIAAGVLAPGGAPVLIGGFAVLAYMTKMGIFVGIRGSKSIEAMEVQNSVNRIKDMTEKRDRLMAMNMDTDPTPQQERKIERMTSNIKREGANLLRFLKNNKEQVTALIIDVEDNTKNAEKMLKELIAFAETVERGSYTLDKRLATHLAK